MTIDFFQGGKIHPPQPNTSVLTSVIEKQVSAVADRVVRKPFFGTQHEAAASPLHGW
ncbi:uncharacterized protein LOC143246905 isoform X2 [Tachypleus tridentatus]|uniref:uncharacterized protein LOC143246905 isoform X2 n=1 Tax=Tachypleus tridentatus TaxID=6853 RepID=UPI003FD197E1